MNFYMHYMSTWPEYFQIATSPCGKITGYCMCLLSHSHLFLFFFSLSLHEEICITWQYLFVLIDIILLMMIVIGKAEGNNKQWHGHVSAVTVAPRYRNLGLATKLMNICEEVTNKRHNAWFVDLFVRSGNKVAIKMYEKLGYSIYRTVLKYYSDNGEDGLDLRKPMERDKDRVSLLCKKTKIKPSELEWD